MTSGALEGPGFQDANCANRATIECRIALLYGVDKTPECPRLDSLYFAQFASQLSSQLAHGGLALLHSSLSREFICVRSALASAQLHRIRNSSRGTEPDIP